LQHKSLHCFCLVSISHTWVWIFGIDYCLFFNLWTWLLTAKDYVLTVDSFTVKRHLIAFLFHETDGPVEVEALSFSLKAASLSLFLSVRCAVNTIPSKEYEILRSPGSRASLSKTGQVYHYCTMCGICLLNRAISPTFLPLCPRHSTFYQMYFPPSSPQDTVDSTRCIFLMGV
jgi:hypothetical protein